MANYWYDLAKGVYYTQTPSDSDPRVNYHVGYSPDQGIYACTCPGFQFNKRCKHIDREGPALAEYAEDRERPVESEEKDSDPSNEVGLSVSLNNNVFKEVDSDTVSWLIESLSPGDTVTVRRG